MCHRLPAKSAFREGCSLPTLATPMATVLRYYFLKPLRSIAKDAQALLSLSKNVVLNPQIQETQCVEPKSLVLPITVYGVSEKFSEKAQ